MALDLQVLTLEVEQAFELKFTDADFRRILTVGDLIRYICAQVQRTPGSACMTSRTFYRLRRELMQTASLERHEIQPAANLEELIPWKERRRVWRDLRNAGLNVPPLQISGRLFNATALLVGVLPVASFLWFKSFALLFLALALCSSLAWLLTRPGAVYLGRYQTIRAAVLHLAPARSPEQGDTPSAALTDREIAEKVRRIIADHDVPIETLSDDARLREDLGRESI